MSDQKTTYPWREGNYKAKWFINGLLLTGDIGTPTDGSFTDFKITFEHGDFGEADSEVVKVSGETKYSVLMKLDIMGKEHLTKCVLTDDGKKFFFKNNTKILPIGSLEWITQEEADILANAGDSIDAPISHYKPEPERQGNLVWITGVPGLGKSTTGQLLSRHHGYIYYEGDCFFGLKNPYIAPDVPEPSIATQGQRKLVGKGAKERQELGTKVWQVFMKMFFGGEDIDNSDNILLEEGYKAMCDNIKKERMRLGGDWAICCILLTKKLRDLVRYELGEGLKIVWLEMEPEDQMARLKSRHSGNDDAMNMMKAMSGLSEPPTIEEPNTSVVKVTSDKTPEDILEIVLEKIQMTEENSYR